MSVLFTNSRAGWPPNERDILVLHKTKLSAAVVHENGFLALSLQTPPSSLFVNVLHVM